MNIEQANEIKSRYNPAYVEDRKGMYSGEREVEIRSNFDNFSDLVEEFEDISKWDVQETGSGYMIRFTYFLED
jgi:hypothetical protein